MRYLLDATGSKSWESVTGGREHRKNIAHDYEQLDSESNCEESVV